MTALQKIINISKRRGGICLSKRYYYKILIKLKCEYGHIWRTKSTNILKGSWCPICAGNRKNTIKDMRKLAKKYRGRCISTKYVTSEMNLTWECSEGHRWRATPSNVKHGHWCPRCYRKKEKLLNAMRLVAKKRGGECLSKRFIDTSHKGKWKCAKGHVWRSIIKSVVYKNVWCPKCNVNQYINSRRKS